MRGFLPDWMDDVLKADGTVNVAALLPGDPTARAEARRR
jgi:hypothetical protein